MKCDQLKRRWIASREHRRPRGRRSSSNSSGEYISWQTTAAASSASWLTHRRHHYDTTQRRASERTRARWRHRGPGRPVGVKRCHRYRGNGPAAASSGGRQPACCCTCRAAAAAAQIPLWRHQTAARVAPAFITATATLISWRHRRRSSAKKLRGSTNTRTSIGAAPRRQRLEP